MNLFKNSIWLGWWACLILAALHLILKTGDSAPFTAAVFILNGFIYIEDNYLKNKS